MDAIAATASSSKSWADIFKDAVETLPVIPTFILFALLLFAFVIVARAQSRKDFDFADMLRDEAGKVSSTRMYSFICLAVTSWVIATLTISDKLTSDYFWYYLLVWSGTAVALKLIDRWNGTLPFSKSAAAAMVQSGAEAAATGAAAVQQPQGGDAAPAAVVVVQPGVDPTAAAAAAAMRAAASDNKAP